MANVYTIGETVLDMIFSNNQPVAAKAGGSMLNTSVSLGRLGIPVYFISEYGIDKVGQMIESFLKENSIDTRFVHHYNDGKTALAMAFLDENNNASYDFYKLYPRKRLEITIPAINADDYVMFGSFYGITNDIRPTIKDILAAARQQGSVIYYDPNFRKAHLHELEQLRPLIIENMQMATVVRCSNEDMELIAGARDAASAYKYISQYCPNMIYTDSSKGVSVYTPSGVFGFPVRKINPVSTIGAGDTFNAGIIHSFWKAGIRKHQIPTLKADDWGLIITNAVDFATEVCMSYENYISVGFAQNFTKTV
ncbi:MAG TPA: carbohydrate kinase [Bacteroidales bacterium]|nr:carbohydrate kinase [Bacteroidales bacterium]